jgi:Holliday junction DNA helicase RuvA
VGTHVKLLTHFVVREDAHLLFGFVSSAERDLFRLLIQHVTGVGPKIALAVLSGMSVPQFKIAVVNGEVSALAKVSGIGKKTAERIILELKDKIGVTASWEVAASGRSDQQTKMTDAVLALLSLGFKQVEAQKAVREILSEAKAEDINMEELVRRALKLLA